MIVLGACGCGPLVDSDYQGPPLARISCLAGWAQMGLLWNVEDPKLGNHYVITSQQQLRTFDNQEPAWSDVDIFSRMPGEAEFGYAYVALFGQTQPGQPIDIAGSAFAVPATLEAVDTQHVLVFARSLVTPPAGGIVWPHNFVIDNPEKLLGPGYHVAEVRCGPDGKAQQPMHVAVLTEALDRDNARPRFNLTQDSALAQRSTAIGGIPLGPVGTSCLVLP
jgi:hypothetical protein